MQQDLPTLAEQEAQDHETFNAEKDRILAVLIRARKPTKVLDIGVCTGIFWHTHFPDLLAQGAVAGVDINDNFLERAAERGVKTLHCNIDNDPLPYPDASFDFVLADSLLEHTLRPRQLLLEIQRVLRPAGGTALLIVPNATTAIARWRMLRGDSPFHPLIDNLFTRDYQNRCAVFYSPADLSWALSQFFTVENMLYLDRTSHDPKTIMMKLLRFVSRFLPQTRDIIFATATKQENYTKL